MRFRHVGKATDFKKVGFTLDNLRGEFTEDELVYFLSMFDSYILSEELAIKGWTLNKNMDKSLCIVDKTFSFDDDQDLEKYNWVII